MTLKEILKAQEEEFEKLFPSKNYEEVDEEGNNTGKIVLAFKDTVINPNNIKSFIQSYNAKIIEAVAEEMTGKIEFSDEGGCGVGYYTRVQEERKKAQELEKEVCNN